jgi:hypothetical protein
MLGFLVLALAAAADFQHQGRLIDALGNPVEGTFDLTFGVYADPSGGAALWSGVVDDVSVQGGYYAVGLPIPPATFDGGARYLQVQVGAGSPMVPRSPVGAVPGASGGSGGAGGQADSGVTSPASCNTANQGMLWYDNSNHTLKVCNGGTYVSVASVTPPPGPPATAPVVGAGNGFLQVTWAAVSGATSYEVGWVAGTNFTAPNVVAVPSGTTTTVNSLTNGQVYTFAVRTLSGGWTSPYSATATGTPSINTKETCPTRPIHPNNSSQDVMDIPVGTWACFVSADGWVYALKLSNPLPRTTGTTGLIGGSSRNYIAEAWTRSPGGVWRQTTDVDDPPTRPGPPTQMYTDDIWYGNGAYWLFSDASCTSNLTPLSYSYQIWSGRNCSDGTTTLFWANGQKHYISELRY